MTDEHPYLRALRLIDALVCLTTEQQRELVLLRATTEARLHRIERWLQPRAARPLGATQQRILALLQDAGEPRRTTDIAATLGTSMQNADHALQGLKRLERITQDPTTKRWSVTSLDDEEKPMPKPTLKLALLATWLLLAATATAQPVLNPSTIIFQASGDHDAVEPITGQPMVAMYRFEVIEDGAAGPVTSVDLGKPSPLTAPDPETPGAAVGDIVAKPAVLLALPVGKRFTARVVAVGPSGEGTSAPSDPFGRALPPARPPKPPRVTK